MLTVAELAKDLNTSTTTVYRTLRTVQQGKTERLIEKHKGVTYFTAKGEKIMREQLKPVPQNDDNRSTMANNVEQVERLENAELLYLREQNKALFEELTKEREHSRQQAERLSELSEKLVDITKNEQILMLQSKNAILFSDEPPPDSTEQDKAQADKKSLWQRLFKPKN